MRASGLVAAAAIAAGASAGAVAAGMVAAAYRFETVRLRLPLARLAASVRVAFLCDLHLGPYMRTGSLRAWVDASNDAEPDAVVLGGDLVDHRAGSAALPALVHELARLRAPLGVHAVWGNHDHRRFGRNEDLFLDALEAACVAPLRNGGVRLRPDLYLAGVDDLRTGTADVRGALAGRPAGGACLLVSHNPDLLPEVPAGEVDLTLCGHTHGGQVRIPGVGAVVTSSRYGRLFAQGWARASALGYVSRGLGVGALPIRLACPAELTVADLLPGD